MFVSAPPSPTRRQPQRHGRGAAARPAMLMASTLPVWTLPVWTLLVWTLLAVALPLESLTAQDQSAPKLLSVKKIWDQAPHNAFTDLTRFRGKWFCVFREGRGHVSPDGALRVLVSEDAEQWRSAALLTSSDADLRDAKITVTPDNRLMLSGAAAVQPPADYKHQSLVWYSDDGFQWSDPVPVADRDFWLWRVTWIGNDAYGFGYATNAPSNAERFIRLYHSSDGKSFQTLIANAFSDGYPNETSILVDQDKTAWCLLRRDGEKKTAQLGSARPPYDRWRWRDLGVQVGGPHWLQLPDGRVLAAVRLYDGGARTSLCWLDLQAAKLTECLKLPSGGDCSYAGLAYHEGVVLVSYYSSHEGKTSIYLAKVQP